MQLSDVIRDAGLGRHAELIQRLAKPSIRLIASRIAEGESLPVGASRIGGTPDLPEGMKWARSTDTESHFAGWNNRSEEPLTPALPFLAQINFAETASLHVPNSPLPTSGFLFAWMDLDRATWQLRYAEAGVTELIPSAFPDGMPEDRQYPTFRLVHRLEVTLPYYGSHGTIGGGLGEDSNLGSFFDSLDPESIPGMLTHDEEERYDQLRLATRLTTPRGGVPEADSHRLLGNADIVQNPMILDCEVRASDFPYDYPTLCDVSDPLTQRLISQTRDSEWTLLLQIDSVSSTNNMMWGDGGTHYWWIKRDDMLRCDFSNVQYDFQCG